MRLKAVNHLNHPNRVNQAHSLNRVARLKVEAQAVRGTLSISEISGKRTDTARTMSLLMPRSLLEIQEYGHMKMVHLSLGRTGRRQLSSLVHALSSTNCAVRTAMFGALIKQVRVVNVTCQSRNGIVAVVESLTADFSANSFKIYYNRNMIQSQKL